MDEKKSEKVNKTPKIDIKSEHGLFTLSRVTRDLKEESRLERWIGRTRSTESNSLPSINRGDGFTGTAMKKLEIGEREAKEKSPRNKNRREGSALRRKDPSRSLAEFLSASPVGSSATISSKEEELSPELMKAISYLGSYWSVGEIRFIMDLKRMGVATPEMALRALVDRGYATLTSLGVVNATKKLPVQKKSFKLADLLG